MSGARTRQAGGLSVLFLAAFSGVFPPCFGGVPVVGGSGTGSKGRERAGNGLVFVWEEGKPRRRARGKNDKNAASGRDDPLDQPTSCQARA